MRNDLVNPFLEHAQERQKVVTVEVEIAEWKRQVAAAHILDSMTPDERAAERELSLQTLERSGTTNKVVRLKRDVSSKASMLDALDRLGR